MEFIKNQRKRVRADLGNCQEFQLSEKRLGRSTRRLIEDQSTATLLETEKGIQVGSGSSTPDIRTIEQVRKNKRIIQGLQG